MPSFLMTVTRWLFSGMGAISPVLAGKMAFLLFCLTPSRRPKGSKARQAHSKGERLLRAAETITLSFPRGTAKAYRFNGGPRGRRPRYLVVHGWGSGSAYMSPLAASLAETGAEVISLDFPGHGRSPGRLLNISLAVEAISAVQARFGTFDATIGHSFGGAATIISAAGLLPDVEALSTGRMVIIGAPSTMGWLFAGFGRMIGLKPAAQAAFEAEATRITGRRVDEFDAASCATGFRQPVLVLHAEDDKEVGAEHARAYAAAGTHVRVHWANGFGHRRIVSAEPVIAAIHFFLDEDHGTVAGPMQTDDRSDIIRGGWSVAIASR
jgi:pimeloyl-ACP methyl ester carboxylesterase